jgi:hypothetical protein
MTMSKPVGPILGAMLVGLSVLAPPAARAADPGRTVLTFLKIGVDARASALGDAYVAVADDAGATYWNPAGLLGIESHDVMGMHHEWIQDLRHEFAAFGMHRGRHAGGLSFLGLYTEDIQRRDDTGAEAGFFGYSDVAVSGSYAFQVTGDLGLGGTVRYMRQSIDDETLSGLGFDVGGTWRTPVEGVTAGATLRHLGSRLSYDFDGAGSFDLPSTLQAGLAYRRPNLAGGGLLLAADMLAASGDDASLRFGAEYTLRRQFSMGAGYKAGLDNEDVSFGVGYFNKIRVNYAFTPVYNDLGNSHRVSVGYSW